MAENMEESVVQNDSGEPEGTGNNTRLAFLQQIADSNDTSRAEDFQDMNDDGSTEPFVVQTAEGETQPLADESTPDADAQSAIQAIETEEQQNAQIEQLAHQKHRIKVNGRELELTTEQLIARAQKIEAADQYLAEASRIRNEVTQQLPKQDAAVSTVEDDLAIARAIQMGTEEEAVAALRSLRQSQKSLSPDEISRTVDERLTFNEAISKFRSEYQDVVTNPVLDKMAKDLDNQLIAQGDKRSYYERYKDIGETVRTEARKIASMYAPPVPPVVAKLDRKASAPAPVRAQGAKTESSIVEEKEETPSEIIRNIAKNRGGPQWMRA